MCSVGFGRRPAPWRSRRWAGSAAVRSSGPTVSVFFALVSPCFTPPALFFFFFSGKRGEKWAANKLLTPQNGRPARSALSTLPLFSVAPTPYPPRIRFSAADTDCLPAMSLLCKAARTHTHTTPVSACWLLNNIGKAMDEKPDRDRPQPHLPSL